MVHDSLTLSELNLKIRDTINLSFPDQYWVTAEVSEISTNQTGHCYMELVEKESTGDHITARMRATIWAYTFRMLRPYFENTTGYRLSTGIRIMVKASVNFHELYGLSLNITDIDPTYTLGDLARKKIEIINRLTNDGVIDMNKQLDFPVVPQRIAIISSATAAGYGDFLNTLSNNNFGFAFETTLFEAIMQGEKAAASIISALEAVFSRENEFDAVALIRGGGAQADLECFNNYDLAYHITQFPLPVITGIGHERDETIADLVAYQKLKTPTAVAEFLIDRLAAFLEYIQSAGRRLGNIISGILIAEKDKLTDLTRILSVLVNRSLTINRSKLAGMTKHASLTVKQYFENKGSQLEQRKRLTFLYAENRLAKHKTKLDYLRRDLKIMVAIFLRSGKDKLQHYTGQSISLDPKNILKRGFSITYVNGTVLKQAEMVEKGDEMTTRLFKGSIKSRINRIISNKDKDDQKRN